MFNNPSFRARDNFGDSSVGGGVRGGGGGGGADSGVMEVEMQAFEVDAAAAAATAAEDDGSSGNTKFSAINPMVDPTHTNNPLRSADSALNEEV